MVLTNGKGMCSVWYLLMGRVWFLRMGRVWYLSMGRLWVVRPLVPVSNKSGHLAREISF